MNLILKIIKCLNIVFFILVRDNKPTEDFSTILQNEENNKIKLKKSNKK